MEGKLYGFEFKEAKDDEFIIEQNGNKIVLSRYDLIPLKLLIQDTLDGPIHS